MASAKISGKTKQVIEAVIDLYLHNSIYSSLISFFYTQKKL